jgi:hypothetical protein
MRPSSLLRIGALLFGVATVRTLVLAQRPDAFVASRDHPAIGYSTLPTSDAVSQLNRRMDEGSLQLGFQKPTGYLRGVLEALQIPVESQVVVHSPTSLQADRIDMGNPRAIYFNDHAAVGWVRGASVLEVAAEDPRQGVVFYRLRQTPDSQPRFTRDNDCLGCHLSWGTLGVPGFFVLSTFPRADKNAYANGFESDHRASFHERWGGWYVTGKTGSIQHLGNIPVEPPDSPGGVRAEVAPGPLATLADRFDTTGYLSPFSDVVALMVLEHQTHMTNLITRVGWETRLADFEGQGAVTPRVRSAIDDLVDYLLFIDETPLPSPIEGSSGFKEKFSSAGPRDSRGRSLRDLDLTHRLMRYPCSYMIYSEAFDALPQTARGQIYTRLQQILSGDVKDARHARLSPGDRQAIVEILRDTKKGLPRLFQSIQ